MSGWPMEPPVMAAEVAHDFELPAVPEDFVPPVYVDPEAAPPAPEPATE